MAHICTQDYIMVKMAVFHRSVHITKMENYIITKKYNTKGEVTEEANFDEDGNKTYCIKFTYKYRSDATVSEQIHSSEDGTHVQTYLIDNQGRVTKTIHADGWSETHEQKYDAGIYYTPSFSTEY